MDIKINELQNTLDQVYSIASTMRQLGDLAKAKTLTEAARIIESYIKLAQVFHGLSSEPVPRSTLDETARSIIRAVIETEREGRAAAEERLLEVETIAEFYRKEAEKALIASRNLK